MVGNVSEYNITSVHCFVPCVNQGQGKKIQYICANSTVFGYSTVDKNYFLTKCQNISLENSTSPLNIKTALLQNSTPLDQPQNNNAQNIT